MQPVARTDAVTAGMLGTGSLHTLAQEMTDTTTQINANVTSTSLSGSHQGYLLLKMSLDSGT